MITITNLTKTYGHTRAVDDVSFSVAAGQITGFLGPNGAGKSTVLRCITGLTRPTAGTTTVLGVPFTKLPNPGQQVGVLLDASALHPGRTGMETLKAAALAVAAPPQRVSELLSKAGLTTKEAGKRVGTYSLGMRQRLGVAQALMGAPAVLILDEPSNGLDPSGMYWMRNLLREFADEGGAVLLSSHLLHEVQQIADQLVVIGAGRIVIDGEAAELLAGTDLESLFLNLTVSREGAPA